MAWDPVRFVGAPQLAFRDQREKSMPTATCDENRYKPN
jgi:hypothetical protein